MQCWLCTHSDHPDVVTVMRYVEERSAVTHVEVLAAEIAEKMQEQMPEHAEHFTEDKIKTHIARHVVTPVASVTRITRHLLDLCESLRPDLDALAEGGPPRKRRRGRPRKPAGAAGDAAADADDDADDDAPAPDAAVATYLHAVRQVMQIYRLHAKLLQPPA